MGKKRQPIETESGFLIPLTRNQFAKISSRDLPKLAHYLWYASEQGKHGRFYAVRWAGRRKVWMHRVIMDCPDTHVVDHMNGDGLDNRRENLRCVLYEENAKYAADKTNSRPKRTVDDSGPCL